MRTISVSLPESLLARVEELVRGGRWPSVDECVSDALTEMALGEPMRPFTHEELKHELQLAIDESERGELIDGQEYMDRWIADIDARVAAS